MEIRALGETDLRVSRLGAGLAEIGFGLTFTEELHRRFEQLDVEWEQQT